MSRSNQLTPFAVQVLAGVHLLMFPPANSMHVCGMKGAMAQVLQAFKAAKLAVDWVKCCVAAEQAAPDDADVWWQCYIVGLSCTLNDRSVQSRTNSRGH